MRNPIKLWFLFFGRHPVLYTFLLLFTLVFWRVVFFDSPGQITFPTIFWLYFGLLVGHMILVYIIINAYITRGINELADAFVMLESNCMFYYLVTKDGRKLPLDKPLWDKGKVYQIKNPQDCWAGEYFTVYTSLSGKFKNSVTTIPVSLKVILDQSKKFNGVELLDRLRNDQNKNSILDIDTYIGKIFQRFNATAKYDIDELIKRFALKEISEPALIDGVLDLLIFPENIFSNVKDVTISLGNPTFSACKGMACGS